MILIKENVENFNPRSRVGNDNKIDDLVGLKINFNPRSRVGNDKVQMWNRYKALKFQSTFPRGERP